MSKATSVRGSHPKKAGPKRPPNMVSYYDHKTGKRHWKSA